MNMKKWSWLLLCAAAVAWFAYYTTFVYLPVSSDELVDLPQEDTIAVHIPKKYYGIIVDSLEIEEGRIKRNQNLADILKPFNIPYEKIHQLAKASKDVYDVRKFGAGKSYTILYRGDSIKEGTHFIYRPNAIDYVVIDFQDSLLMYQSKKEIELREREMYGAINTSLYVDMLALGGDADLVNQLVDVFAWQVDFFGIQKGDHFKIIYDEKYVDDELVGVGKIKAGYFNHRGDSSYGFRFEQENGSDFFDAAGNSLRKEFLKAPLSFTRISSRYTGRRYHPVQKRYKAHRGTDYAAPKGTPIYAAADGRVIAAKYSRFNGNFVKIQHNGNIATQYLHMSKIASGIRSGKKVRRGQTIGYVGSTGLASGNHLCYRFWKNGVQVDALKVKLPPSNPIVESNRLAFDSLRFNMQTRLDMINNNPHQDTLRVNNSAQIIN